MFGFKRRKLLDAIAAAPDAPEPYLEYADSLGWGDRRARLIQLGAKERLETRWPPPAALVQERRALLRESPDLLPPSRGRNLAEPPVWFMGFIRHLALRGDADAEDVQALLAHPSCRFLQTVDVSAGASPAVLELLAERTIVPVPLRSVEHEAPLALGITAARVRRFAEWLDHAGDPRGTWLLLLVEGTAEARSRAARFAGPYGRYLTGTSADRTGWQSTLGFHEHVILRPKRDGGVLDGPRIQALLEHVAGRTIQSIFVADDRIDRDALTAALAASGRPDLEIAPPPMGPPFPELAAAQGQLDAATLDATARLEACFALARVLDELRDRAHVPLRAHITRWAEGHGVEALLFGGEARPEDLVHRVRELLVHPAARKLERVQLEGKGSEAVRVVAAELGRSLEFGRALAEPPAICLGSALTRFDGASGVAIEFGHMADWIPEGAHWDWMMHVDAEADGRSWSWLMGGSDAIDKEFSLSEVPPRSGWLALPGVEAVTVSARVYLRLDLGDGNVRERAWGTRAKLATADQHGPVVFQAISWDPEGLQPLVTPGEASNPTAPPMRTADAPLAAPQIDSERMLTVAAPDLTVWLVPVSRDGDLVVGWRTPEGADSLAFAGGPGVLARERLRVRVHEDGAVVVKVGPRKWTVDPAARAVAMVQ